MPDVTTIPADPTFRTAGGSAFALDLVEAAKEIDRIARATEGKADYSYLDLFRQWVHRVTGGVELSAAEADWLVDHVRLERAKKNASFLATLNSLSSTASTPPASDPEPD